jgi:RNA polymerase sigma-70 factor (ECF subfamily)
MPNVNKNADGRVPDALRPLDDLGDVELVDMARAHALASEREAAFRVLVERYRERVFALCFKMLRSRIEAEDVAQDTFVKAYRKLDSFRGDSQFFTWLYRIALNVARDRMDSVQYRQSKVATDIADIEPVRHDDRERPDRTAEREDLRKVARRVLEHIPPQFRSVLILRELEGMEYREIADTLGLSVGTVMSRAFRARLKFKKLMELFVPDISNH